MTFLTSRWPHGGLTALVYSVHGKDITLLLWEKILIPVMDLPFLHGMLLPEPPSMEGLSQCHGTAHSILLTKEIIHSLSGLKIMESTSLTTFLAW